MIRKHFHDIKIVGVLTALLALASCAGDEFDSTKNADGPKFGLTVVTNDQVSTRTPGDDNLNENRFVSIDYFFFAQNSDDNKLLLHKTEGRRNDPDNNTLDNSTHTYNGPLSASDLIAIFGSDDVEDGTTCYVYVLTNLLPSTRAAIESEKTTWGEDFTLGILKRISFQDTNISANGKQECFVMFGGGEVSLTTDADTNVRTISGNPIRVTRDAAKVVLTVRSLQEEVEVKADDGETVVARWKSVPDQMHVMFYNGKNKSNVHSQINAGLHYVPEVNDDCYFDLTAKNSGWRNLTAASNDEPYKNLTHSYPFYTYLSDWTEVSGADPDSYMILVVPWQQVDVETGVNINAPVATYYQIQTSTTDTYYENYYYHIFIDVGILGSFELPEPEVIEGTYMIVPWGEKNIDATMREPVYLIVEENEYTMNNVNSASIPYISSHEITQAYVTKIEYINIGDFQNVTVNHNNTSIVWTTNTYVNNERFEVTTDDNLLTLTHTISPNQYTRYLVTVRIVNSKGLQEDVVFTIYPAIFAEIEDGGDAFINGRFAHVNNPVSSGNPGWYQVTGTYYRSSAQQGYNPSYVATGYGSLVTTLGTDNVSQTALTKITVTSFNTGDDSYSIRANNTTSTYTYKLTDPRVTSNLNSVLDDYWVTARSNRNNQTTASWRNENTILVGSNSNDAIAPEFLICSGWGRTAGQNAQNFQTFERRCAAYQEAGYPAGRWRIPTEAEIAFIYKLQDQGVIPDLFRNGTSYWASSGRAITSNNGTVTASSPNTAGVRCVYDVWYWGEEKMSTNEYHVAP
jgi:hypothetical protein